jgi:hypothetical protein
MAAEAGSNSPETQPAWPVEFSVGTGISGAAPLIKSRERGL